MTSVTSNDLSEPLWSLMASVVSNGLSDLKRPQIVQVLSKLYTQICVDSTGALHFYRATSYLVIRSTVYFSLYCACLAMHFCPIRYCTCFPAAAEITAKMIGKTDGPTSIFHCCRVGIKFSLYRVYKQH